MTALNWYPWGLFGLGMNLALARASRPPADMNKFPERQPVQFCVLWTNPEVNKSEGVGVGTAFRQMVNFLEFYSELAGSLIHPLIVGEKIAKLHWCKVLGKSPGTARDFCTVEIRRVLIVSY